MFAGIDYDRTLKTYPSFTAKNNLLVKSFRGKVPVDIIEILKTMVF
jgi:hypothetical protein